MHIKHILQKLWSLYGLHIITPTIVGINFLESMFLFSYMCIVTLVTRCWLYIICTYVLLCVGRSKGKAGIHLKYYPKNRDTFEMYPGKVMHMIGG